MKSGMTRRAFLGGAAAGAATLTFAKESSAMATPWEAIPLEKPLDATDLPTPALFIDVEVMEANLSKMADFLASKGLKARPHTKTHKCPIIAKRQIDLGAVGVCAAKVSEAEVMIDSGVSQVLITSPIATKDKIDRVIALAGKSSGLQMLVDNEKTIKDFNAAAEAAGVTLNVLLGLDTGTRRTGIALGKPALDLVKLIHKMPFLNFEGIQAYAGHLMHIKGHDKRRERSRETIAKCLETKALVEKNGYDVPVFTGGGTGTFDIDSGIEGFTDLQVGSYLFMDVQYRRIGDSDSAIFDYFAPSLFVLATAISQPVPELITIDAGYKAFASDSVRPEFRDIEGLAYNWGGDEHGICQIKDNAPRVNVGDKMALIVSHCDPTVNLYDYYHPVRNGRVEELWPISARGRSQ